MNRTLWAALVCLGFIVGTVSSRSARADDVPPPYAVGDKIRLLYENSGARECDVTEIRGQMVKCAQGKDGLWLNLTITLGIDRRR